MLKTVSSSALAVNEHLLIQKNRIENNTDKCSKRVCVVTGTHGDELEGQYVCAELIRELNENIDLLSGTVDVYPALNPLGIDTITRGIPNFDIDMNRNFPGSPKGTYAEVVAHDIITDIEGADICIDVHSSNIYLEEVPQIRMSVLTANTLMPYGKMLNIDFIWVHQAATVLESTLAHSLNTRGVKTLVVEMGVGMRITEKYCRQLLDGIFNMLKELGMWKGETKKVREPIVSDDDNNVSFLNSPSGGIYVPMAAVNTEVAEGEIIGRVLDPFTGEIVEDVKSPVNGWLFTRREYPVVYGGSLLGRILGGTAK